MHDAFDYYHIISKIQLSMLNCFLVISNSINFAAHLSKWLSKNKRPTRARAKSQLNLLKVTVTLTSYFLKMVPVIVT